MRFVVVFLVGALLLSGCEQSVVKDEYMSLDDLKKTNKFLAYDIVIGPGLEGAELNGPFRITNEVNADIRMETRNPFHRRVRVDDKAYEFKLTEDVIGYGYRFLSVRNRNDELGILVLKTRNKVPSWNINAEGGVLLTEREKQERAAKKKEIDERRAKMREQNQGTDDDKKADDDQQAAGDEKSGDEKSGDEKSGDEKSGDEKSGEGKGDSQGSSDKDTDKKGESEKKDS